MALAKVRRNATASSAVVTRPRLRYEPVSAEQLTLLELDRTGGIERACGDTAGLGVVRPLLLVREDATLVMSYVDAPTLRSMVLRLSRTRVGRGRLDEVVAGCELAGRWLRTFQERYGEHDLPARQGTRDEVVDRLTAYGEFLDSHSWRRLARAGAELVTERLPYDLPLAVGHGDSPPGTCCWTVASP